MPDNNYWSNLMETDENAAIYMDGYGEGPNSDTRQIISSFINNKESVLDVGCGPGWNMEALADLDLKKYKGVDLSPRFVRVANKRRKESNLSSDYVLPFEVQDCRKLKEPKDSWDVVILQDVLEHTNGYQKPVRQALRVARKRIIITFWRMYDRPNKINDDTAEGEDGYGAEYNQKDWEHYLDGLGYFWIDTETPPTANRQHLFYVIDLQEPHG